MSVELAPNGLPRTSEWLFPEYSFHKIDLEDHASVIIERILDRGSWEEVNWLFEHYGEQRLAEWVRRYGFRALSKRSFALWRLVLNVDDYEAPEWAKEAKAMFW